MTKWVISISLMSSSEVTNIMRIRKKEMKNYPFSGKEILNLM